MRTKKFTRRIGWGEALHLEIHYRSPGIKPVVEAIHEAVGPDCGNRNTFAKLEDLSEPPTTRVWQWRAWLLLTALGQDPAAWHIPDDVVPAAYDTERLRTLVRSSSRWITTDPGQLSDLAA